jgi:hypothetical protein
MVEMRYGRIGTTGQRKIRSFSHIDDARAQVRTCLKRRATAPRRIGVGYQMRGLEGAIAWVSFEQGERLAAWFPCKATAREGKDLQSKAREPPVAESDRADLFRLARLL